MKIRNVVFSMVVALAAASTSYAGTPAASTTPADVARAYSLYERATERLDAGLDTMQDRLNHMQHPATQEDARTASVLRLQLAVLQARRDVARDQYLAAKAQQQRQK